MASVSVAVRRKYLAGLEATGVAGWLAAAIYLVMSGCNDQLALERELYQCPQKVLLLLASEADPRQINSDLSLCTDLGSCLNMNKTSHIEAICNITCAVAQLYLNNGTNVLGYCQDTAQSIAGQTKIFAGSIMLVVAAVFLISRRQKIADSFYALFCRKRSHESHLLGSIQYGAFPTDLADQ